MPNKKLSDKEAATQRAFSLYLKGWSLRKLQSHFNTPKSTLRDRFERIYGRGYTNLRSIIDIIKEYLTDPKISTKDKEQIREWLNSPQLFQLLLNVKSPNTKFYTDKQIRSLTLKECFHKSRDFKELFELLIPIS
ncbi:MULTISPECIES: helix-turn-helix domain-containing protein [Calothrix]|uniref:HTH psq-type domain-containing protein n=2 Tax=Calothrix TaxID=1186 RepID=A0ABR8A9C6_9CYAN|nr:MULTISPECIES: helix-turn-helix domain-containing protein [Calothrix]MBD2196602.1 hypothetical protein [Calothrix parietina FACHB-288]MBD2228033.1 hypothetical protein [Calothrix anomala FACHB-343]